jgi:hypothetical protein
MVNVRRVPRPLAPVCSMPTATAVSAIAFAPSATRVTAYVIWYSGPSPPSGVVSRPPLAVIAPHWTQFV